MEAILTFGRGHWKLFKFGHGMGRGGEEIVQSEAGIAAVAGFLKGGGEGGWRGSTNPGQRGGGGGEGASVPCCCTFPSISLSLHSGWLWGSFSIKMRSIGSAPNLTMAKHYNWVKNKHDRNHRNNPSLGLLFIFKQVICTFLNDTKWSTKSATTGIQTLHGSIFEPPRPSMTPFWAFIAPEL
jgi:hypothetical protein